MNIEQILSYTFLLSALLHLAQAFKYGFKEYNRPTILFGVIYLFLAFALFKEEKWIAWACLMVPAVGFMGVLSGFSESIKPNWLNYIMMLLNLALIILSAYHLLY